MAAYPDIQSVLNTDKHELLEVRRTVKSVAPAVLLFIAVVVAVFFLDSYLIDWRPPDIPIIRHFSIRWLSIVPAMLLLEILRECNDDLYVLELHRITRYEGRLSLNYLVPNVRYCDIKAICIKQGLLGRMLNYGDIELSTAATDGTELPLAGVASPEELAHLIEALRKNSITLERRAVTPRTVIKVPVADKEVA